MARISDSDQNIDIDELTVIQAIRECRTEADDARISRISQNKRNRDIYLGRQDWSGKVQGQSTEFLPKVPVSVEQMAAFVRRGLIQFGDWYSIEPDRTLGQLITGAQIVHILNAFLGNLWNGNDRTTSLPLVLSDGVKVALLESLMIFKVHGGMKKSRSFAVEPGEVLLDEEAGTVTRGPKALKTKEEDQWHLRIDLIRPEDYYPDPTGNGLYEIHRVERDLHEVVEAAKAGVYDESVVNQLIDEDFKRPDDEERSDKDRAQDDAPPPSFRKRVMLDEFWGTLLHADGTVAHRNVVATVGNDKFLIRKPEPNPFWHQESPFVACPLIRVPWSVWHKALYDNASDLNLAINEVFNLMLDGGLASVWGVKQVRLDDLEDAGQVSGGIQQGMTLAVKSTLPAGTKVLETVSEGEVPPDAMNMLAMLENEYAQAALTNQIRMGQLPTKQVRSAEIMEAGNAQDVTLEGMVADMEESCIRKVLEKSWHTVLQNADDLPADLLSGLVDKKIALMIMRSSPAERFALFAGRCKFRAFGLSASMAQAKDFQKMMALWQAVQSNPFLLQAFMVKYSADKNLRHLMKTLSINPDDLFKTEEEIQGAPEELMRTAVAGQLIGGGRNGGLGGNAGSPGLQGEVNQSITPATGMPGNA